MNKDCAIIIFVRQPELGKVKTRLAVTMGNEKALAVYRFLLQHTYGLIKDSLFAAYVFYAGSMAADDLWRSNNIKKKIQEGNDLGEKMSNAFKTVFADGFSKLLIIGSDCYELTIELINQAFEQLSIADIVIGPARDGGYYLLGMNAPFKDLFQNIVWSTSTVYSETLKKINQHACSVAVLPVLTDVDTAADITFLYE